MKSDPTAAPNMKNRFLDRPAAGVLLLLAFLPFAAGCTGEGRAAETAPAAGKKDSAATAKKKEAERVPVEVAALASGPIESVLRFSTNLEAESAVEVFSQASRLVERLQVEEGDRVRRGDVLVRLVDDQQRAHLARVEAQLAKAEREYAKQKRLFAQELISQQAHDETLYEVEQRQIDVADARRELSYAEVRAPISGTVTRRLVNLGDTITVNQHLFDIVDFDTLVARIFVPEKEMARLGVGQQARILSAALGGGPRRGEVERIAPVVDPKSGTVKVTVGIPDGGEGLAPGMYVEVELVTDVHQQALLVPKRAVVYDNDQAYVFRLVEGGAGSEAEQAEAEQAEQAEAEQAEQADVEGAPAAANLTVERLRLEIALENSNHVEPAADSGLAAGDRVVIAGQAGLKSGTRVRLVGEEV